MKKYLYLLSVLFVLPLLLFTSCLEKEETEVPTALLKKWNLKVIAYTDKADLLPPQGAKVWIEFAKKQTSPGYSFNGVASPNIYFGDITLSNEGTNGTMLVGDMAATEIGSTKMLSSEFEIEYFNLLRLATSYSIQQNTLILHCPDGEKLIYTSGVND
ncbi:META domain-containing protein [Pontibacter sp. H259]|uniref:META domain-containing protein n=1 Tax=Pontibacter sp. H259 TaxID=3133421 RepID=UPI0030BCBBE3